MRAVDVVYFNFSKAFDALVTPSDKLRSAG